MSSSTGTQCVRHYVTKRAMRREAGTMKRTEECEIHNKGTKKSITKARDGRQNDRNKYGREEQRNK